MFIIDFRNKNMSKYCFSVINNSNVDVVKFLSRFTQYINSSIYLKIRSSDDTYIDKIAIASEDVSIDEDALVVKWTMGAVSTQCKQIDLQLQFEEDDGEIIAQTGIVTLTLGNTIDVSHEIEPIYPDVLKHLQEEIDDLDDSKVDKVEGMGLSHNDFTTAEKEKLAGIEAGADVNIIEGVQVDGTDLTPDANKEVNIDLTGKVDKTTSANKVYGTDSQGGQTTYTVDSFFEGSIVRRDSDNSITVPLAPTQNGHATSKQYVDRLIDEIEQRSDVVDVVGTYAELQAYDTTHLAPNSLIKVINDETHDNEITYYRWVITEGVGAWVYVASEGAYYTTAQIDLMLGGYYKKDANLVPDTNNAYDLGSANYTFKGLYLSGKIYFDTWSMNKEGNNFSIYLNNNAQFTFSSAYLISRTGADLGSSTYKWKDLYLAGVITNGSVSIAVDEIVNTNNLLATDQDILDIMGE